MSRPAVVAVALVIVVVLVLLALVAGAIARGGGRAGADANPSPTQHSATPAVPSAPAASATAGPPATLVELIGRLAVAPEHRAGYDRDLFEHWIDADGDGCNTRHEVLIDESVAPLEVDSNCWITGGRWVSAYDGFVTTDIGEVQIDHVVALAEAWRSGAYDWTPARREAFANDLGVPWTLAAVSGPSNEAKADLEPGEWLPPLESARCPFLVHWVAIKVRWQLSVDRVEQASLLDLAGGCGAEPVPSIPAPASP